MGGLSGLGLALCLRLRVAGAEGAHSAAAGAVFGIALLALAVACGLRRPTVSWRQLRWGVGGAGVLCLAPLLHHLTDPGAAAPLDLLPAWAAVVTLVAVAEELLLRGAVYEALARWRGQHTAIAVTAVAFALLHIPVYGWTVLPLDLAVGVFLGVLRSVAGSVTAPALTHVLADLAGWWLR
jgi:membrane protease YdiL (CAAX protease family)